MAQRSSRKKRKQRQRSRQEGSAPRAASAGAASAAGTASAGGASAAAPATQAAPASREPSAMARGYSRQRARDDQARAKLKPLRPGERPRAVTVGAIVALVAALANLVALLIGYESDESNKVIGSLLPVPILLLVAWGMWKSKYWAVLGMQTLLALTIIGTALAGIQAQNLRAALVVVGVLVPSTVLFWFLVKAMARIQMPERPGAQRR